MKRFVLILAACGLMTSCLMKETIRDVAVPDNALTINPNLTKVMETAFEEGDAIGLTVIRENNVWAQNAHLTYNGSVFAGDLNWYIATDAATFKAYYPYQASVPTSFSVALDQTEGTASSDFIAAVKENVVPTPLAVPMVFDHKFSRIVINLDNQSGGEVLGVALAGSIPTATVDENFQVAVATGSTAEILAYKVSDAQYQLIAVPQTVAFTVKVTVGDDVQSTTLVPVTLLSGKQYTVNVLVHDSGIQVIISAEINNWDDGGEIPSASMAASEAVDMGLSVKWASCNLGATLPEEFGYYYAWGETQPKQDYSWATYAWCTGTSTSMTKYCLNANYGVVDNKTTLEAADDAAHVNLGNGWRIPTRDEWAELYANSTWTWTTYHGVLGGIITSTVSGYEDKFIFLPAAGRMDGTEHTTQDAGCYWSSTMSTNNNLWPNCSTLGSSGPPSTGCSTTSPGTTTRRRKNAVSCSGTWTEPTRKPAKAGSMCPAAASAAPSVEATTRKPAATCARCTPSSPLSLPYLLCWYSFTYPNSLNCCNTWN